MAENNNLDMLTEVFNMDLIYWSVRLYSRRGGDGGTGVSLIWPSARITLLEYMNI